MKPKNFKIKSDNNLNPEDKAMVQGVRGILWKNIPEIENTRFQMSQCTDYPGVLIIDTHTGIITNEISLHNLPGAIQLLNELKL